MNGCPGSVLGGYPAQKLLIVVRGGFLSKQWLRPGSQKKNPCKLEQAVVQNLLVSLVNVSTIPG